MRNGGSWSPAHRAVEFEDTIQLRRLFANGTDPDERTPGGMTLLHHAVDVEIDGATQTGTRPGIMTTKAIVEAGANPFARWEDITALDDAVERGHSEASDLLARTIRDSATGEAIAKALAASLDDDIFPEWEFHALIGSGRDIAQSALESWPLPALITSDWVTSARHERDVIVNNVLNMLLGYPHGLDGDAFTARVGCSQRTIARAMMTWRDEEDWERGGKGFFNRMS